MVEIEQSGDLKNISKKFYKIEDLECPDFLDYNEDIEKKRKGFIFLYILKILLLLLKDEKKKLNYQEDLANVIKQYEARINRMVFIIFFIRREIFFIPNNSKIYMIKQKKN